MGDRLSPHRPWKGTLSRWSRLDVLPRDLIEPIYLPTGLSRLMPVLWTVTEGHTFVTNCHVSPSVNRVLVVVVVVVVVVIIITITIRPSLYTWKGFSGSPFVPF